MASDALADLGLSSRERTCYLALLDLGESTVGPIVRRTRIPSSKIYEVLDRLADRGLVSHVVKGKTRHYQASDPRRLLTYADERRRQLEQLMPELLLKQKLSKRSHVELYDGQDALFGLLTCLIDDAKPHERYFVFSIDEENKTLAADRFFKNLAVRRKEKRLDVRVLKHASRYVRERHTKLQLRYTQFHLPQGITVFRDRVILLSWRESPVAISIENEQFAAQWREFFLELWAAAKR